MRQCTTCSEVKDENAFYKSGKYFLSSCKACRKHRYEENREQVLDTRRSHYQKNRQRLIQKQKDYTARHSKQVQAYKRAWTCSPTGRSSNRRRRLKYPEKEAARNALKKAVNSGKLIRPIGCESCGRKAPIEAHHHRGYGQEHWLDVQWLCPPCHRTAEHP